jgi:putative phosphoesterase
VIALLGDTHLPRGARRLPDDCLRLLEASALILHTGDFTAASVLEDLLTLGRVEGVHGNMDDAVLRRELPKQAVVEAEGLRIGLVHDPGPRVGRHGRLRGAFPGCALVAYGHTHMPEVARSDGVWIVNPGSPTERRRAPSHSMVVIRDGRPELVELSR